MPQTVNFGDNLVSSKPAASPLFDTLLIDKVKINNHSFSLAHSELIEKNPDSIIHIHEMDSQEWECGNPFGWNQDSLSVAYVKNQNYLTNNRSSFLYYAKFNTHNSLFIESKNFKLNNETTIEDFKRVFKNSKVTKVGNGYAIFNITFNPSQPEDNWMFYFSKERKLIEFYLDWWLC